MQGIKVFCLCMVIALLSFIASGCRDSKIIEESPEKLKVKKSMKGDNENSYNELTAEESRVIVDKGTERPFTGRYTDHFKEGAYQCKRCNAFLYWSDSKFKSSCGWPSFDDEIKGAVERVPDADGVRTEIVCANCKGHLGHVFKGENYTEKNIRHCVNSISMNFVGKNDLKLGRAIFAGGCFWGVEYFLQQKRGVIETNVGYIGGDTKSPTYQEVCSKVTGHIEAVEVIYDPKKVDYKTLTKLFFEIHDPTQVGRQGPDIGEQYSSIIFYLDDSQKDTAQKLIEILEKTGISVATKLIKAEVFWKGEEYHQDYYQKKGTTPYCHGYTKRFPEDRAAD